MRDHFHNMVRFRCERAAVCEFRKRISWYAKQLHPCVHLKEEMRNITCISDFEAAITRFLNWRQTNDATKLDREMAVV
jgi:tRNA-dihydrouridine synthase